MAAGSVYILRNPFLVGRSGAPLLKIGGTARSARARALELSAATGVPGHFSVVFEQPTGDWQRLEVMTHRALKHHRRTGEFFEIEPARAIAIIEGLNKAIPDIRRSSTASSERLDFLGGDAVRFAATRRGFAVHAEDHPVGSLVIDAFSARYEFLNEMSLDPILEAELLRLPHRQHLDACCAATLEAQRRAAWIAIILKRFTTPYLQPIPGNHAFTISVNGLPLAIVTKRRERRGLFMRRKSLSYTLEPLPCPDAPALNDSFGTTVKITRGKPLSYEAPLFVYAARLGLEESVRRYVLSALFASVSMSHNCWECWLTLPNCEVEIIWQCKGKF